MINFGKGVVKLRIPILIVSIILLFPAALGYFHTRVNYDILTYLPKEIDTMKGQDILLDEFGTGAFSMCVVEGMEDQDISKMRKNMEKVDHVKKILWYDSLADLSIPKTMLPDKVQDAFINEDKDSINAMAYHPQCGLVDLFGGEADLAAGVIRCVGAPAQRFDEDALRMLRALRFAAVLGFEIEADTAGALLAQKELLTAVSAERIREELVRLLCGRDAARVLDAYLPVFGMCLPELLPMQGFAQQNPHHIYDVWHHTLAVVAAIPPQPHLRLAALLHDVGKPDCFTADESGIGHFYQHASIGAEMTRSILRRLKFDNDTTTRVVTLVRWHDRQIEPTAKAVKRALQQFGQETFFDLLALKRADNRGQAPAYAARQADYDRLAAIAAEILASGACFSRKELAVTGRDLMAAGMPAGRELGAALDTLLDAVIDEKVINEKEALLRYLFSNESY